MTLAKVLSCFLAAILSASFVYSSNPEVSKEHRPEQISGRIESINQRVQSLTVRVGDATKTFSFDNKTVFTYGDRTASAGELKAGNEVLVMATKGKAAEINGTQQIEGIIEKIDSKGQKLIVKIGNTIKEIPFILFTVTTSEGQVAAVDNMQVGDSVLLNLNMGFADKTKSKK